MMVLCCVFSDFYFCDGFISMLLNLSGFCDPVSHVKDPMFILSLAILYKLGMHHMVAYGLVTWRLNQGIICHQTLHLGHFMMKDAMGVLFYLVV